MSEYPSAELRVYGDYQREFTDLKFLRHFPSLRRFSVELFDLPNLDDLALLPSELTHLRIGER